MKAGPPLSSRLKRFVRQRPIRRFPARDSFLISLFSASVGGSCGVGLVREHDQEVNHDSRDLLKMKSMNKLGVLPAFSSGDSQRLGKEPDWEAADRPVWYTFRVDASFDRQRGITGIGLILRATNKKGRDGQVMARFSEAYTGLPDSVGEQFAVLRALEIAAEAGCRMVRIRSDYNSMRTALKDGYRAGRGQERRSLQGMILRLAREFDEVKFAWIIRRKNHEAHCLARQAVLESTAVVREDILPLLATGGAET
jgi:ribonuclease HI